MVEKIKRKYTVVKDKPDARDKLYRATAPITIPNHVDLTSKASPVEDQGDTSSCTAHGIAGALEYLENLESEQPIRLSRLFIYFNERKTENDVNQDAGAQIRDGIKSVASLGVCQESLWPFDKAQLFTKPNDDAYSDALKHTALVYRRVAQTESDMLHCLASGSPVVIGLQLFDSFESDAVMNTGIVPIPQGSENCLGGHCMLVMGYDKPKRLFIVRNSWGNQIGYQPEGTNERGYMLIPFDYVLDPNLGNDYWSISKIS